MERFKGIQVVVNEDESIERAIRRLTRKVRAERVLIEHVERQHFRSRGERRRSKQSSTNP